MIDIVYNINSYTHCVACNTPLIYHSVQYITCIVQPLKIGMYCLSYRQHMTYKANTTWLQIYK